MKRGLIVIAVLGWAWSSAGATPNQMAREEVRRTEAAFAKTMADRDYATFTSFLAEDAVFFGQQGVRRGKAAVSQAWRSFFQGTSAPFSWTPESVEVLDSGGLAFSSGPVFDPGGQLIGTFNSVWRREANGTWRIVFDKGCPRCECGQDLSTLPTTKTE